MANGQTQQTFTTVIVGTKGQGPSHHDLEEAFGDTPRRMIFSVGPSFSGHSSYEVLL
jgi:hypothetical protein